jgi:hypothetical protein
LFKAALIEWKEPFSYDYFWQKRRQVLYDFAMGKHVTGLFLFLFVLFYSALGSAFIEIRVGGGLYTEPTAPQYSAFGNDCVTCLPKSSGAQTDTMVDFIIRPFKNNFGFGYRYENFPGASGAQIAPGQTFQDQLVITRNSILVDYRFLNDSFYLGLIASYGFNMSATLKDSYSSSSGPPQNNSMSPSSMSSESLGVELGFLIQKHFIIGIEMGDGIMAFKGFNGPQANFDINFNGFYGVLMVGIGF